MTKNVTVTDETGKTIGTTYPKRARGLVKNGRALYVDDCTIRLSAKAEPSDIKSEVKQMNYIFFNPREWSCSDMARQNIFSEANASAERSFASGFDGGLVEILMLGGWNTAKAEILSKIYPLMPDTDYCFIFWLNGGENDKQSEVCQLRIAFSGHTDGWNVYKLNRNFIKPLLHYQGWELYSITFRTPEADSTAAVPVMNTQFGFLSGYAPMAIQAAKEPEFYKNWEDSPDEFAGQRPQRHNIVFEDGWPSRSMYGGDKYSTEFLRGQANRTNPQKVKNYFNGYTDYQHQNLGQFGKIAEQYKWLVNRYNELEARRQDLYNEYLKLWNSPNSANEEVEDEIGELEGQLEEMESTLSECQELLEEEMISDIQDHFGDAEDTLSEAESLRDEIISQLEEIKTKA